MPESRCCETLTPQFRLRFTYPTLRAVARYVFPSKWDVGIKLTRAGKRPEVTIRRQGDVTVVTAERRDA